VTPAALTTLADAPPLAAAREALGARGSAHVTGPVGPARLLAARLVLGRRLTVFVVPREGDVDTCCADLRCLAQLLGDDGEIHPFPAPGLPGMTRHPEAALRRAVALHAAARGRLRGLVASPAGLLRPTLRQDLLDTRALDLRIGEELIPEMLIEALDDAGYLYEDPVVEPGQYARRGGIVDLFPANRPSPIRIEFVGDTVDAMRSYDVESQRATGPAESVEVAPLSDLFVPRSLLPQLRDELLRLLPASAGTQGLLASLDGSPTQMADCLTFLPGVLVPVWSHLPKSLFAVVEPDAVDEEARRFVETAAHVEPLADGLLPAVDTLVALDDLRQRLRTAPVISVSELDAGGGTHHWSCTASPRFGGDLQRLTAELRQSPATTLMVLGSPGRAERLGEYLAEQGIVASDDGPCAVQVGSLSRGFEMPDQQVLVLADGDIFPEEATLHARGRHRRPRGLLSDFRDLRVGDLVVHEDHGIGRFEGLETLAVGAAQAEFMVLSYQGGDKLKVPVSAFDRVQKYKAADGPRPSTDRLGSGRWDRVKRRVKKSMRDMAGELLKLYAQRKALPGHAFTVDSPWLREFDDGFEFEETLDQHNAISDVIGDMADLAPMDRLVCGDVGYGKTEVAMRAAIRAVVDGKQVAVLAPTTILAFQHWKTFRQRFAPFPVLVEMVSRLRRPKETRSVLEAVADGRVDILIGTHRLLSKDVAFKDLGLLIVDEEQRFGVAAKERLKQLRTAIDCLTLTATPIPRTLQMGLAGLRDMSIIETPPKDRLAIHTAIVKFSTEAISGAIRQELARGGQIYFVHNRVESIFSLAHMVQQLCPEARVGVAHGQMPEGQLEKVMLAFVEGRIDVLVATTIIENGLDIPRANTLIVNRADRFGLAQLYQLRGRVGRSDRRASALLLIPPDTVLSEIARKRLAAIREFSDLGAGFRIAALDLELRGAGNLLGGQQSGHIEAIGLDLYIKLLERTILELKGQAPAEGTQVALNLGLDIRIPEDYVQETEQRIALYKRLSEAHDLSRVLALSEEMRDRYGPVPPSVHRLVRVAAARVRASQAQLVQVDRERGLLALRFSPQANLDPSRVLALVNEWRGCSLAPDGTLRVPHADDEEPLGVLERALDSLLPRDDAPDSLPT
jgi:transcription-repair coupling factor (superfamily II helicase)